MTKAELLKSIEETLNAEEVDSFVFCASDGNVAQTIIEGGENLLIAETAILVKDMMGMLKDDSAQVSATMAVYGAIRPVVQKQIFSELLTKSGRAS